MIYLWTRQPTAHISISHKSVYSSICRHIDGASFPMIHILIYDVRIWHTFVPRVERAFALFLQRMSASCVIQCWREQGSLANPQTHMRWILVRAPNSVGIVPVSSFLSKYLHTYAVDICLTCEAHAIQRGKPRASNSGCVRAQINNYWYGCVKWCLGCCGWRSLSCNEHIQQNPWCVLCIHTKYFIHKSNQYQILVDSEYHPVNKYKLTSWKLTHEFLGGKIWPHNLAWILCENLSRCLLAWTLERNANIITQGPWSNSV